MAGPAFVAGQQGATSAAGNNCTVTLPGAITAGNMLVAVAVTDDNTPPGTSSISDTHNTWTRLDTQAGGVNGSVGIFIALNVAAGSYGVKFTNGTNFVGLSVAEYTPNGQSTADVVNQAASTGTVNPGNLNTTNADDLLVAGATCASADTAWSAGASFGLRGNVTSSANTTVALQDRTVAATSNYAAAFGNSTGAVGWAAAAAAIKAATGGGATAPCLLPLLGVG